MAAYRAAVIGLGRMGSTYDDEVARGGTTLLPYCHGPTYYESPLVDLVAGADINEEQRALFGGRWEVSSDHLYADYKEMLSTERLDVVSVTTTASLRASIVQDAARAGVKAIWAEKPMAMSLEEADAMVRVCREEGVALAINCARRWNPFFKQARAIIQSGELGEILQVVGYCRGAVSHNGSHIIDTVRYLVGSEVEWVFGEMESDAGITSDDDLMGNGYLAFDNGTRAYIRTNPCGAAGWEVDVVGEKGRIRSVAGAEEWELTRMEPASVGSPGFGPSSNRTGGSLPARYPFPWPQRIQGLGLTIVEDLIQAAESGRPPLCSGEDGLAALEIAVAMRESHRRGGVKVELPLPDRSLTIRSLETLYGDEPARVRMGLPTRA